jgi:hypothetical protein
MLEQAGTMCGVESSGIIGPGPLLVVVIVVVVAILLLRWRG